MLCGIGVFPAEVAVLIEIIIVITDACHAVQVIDIVAQEDLLYTDIIGSTELSKFIGRYELPEYQISAGAFFEFFYDRSLALGIGISAIASGIKVFRKLLVRRMESPVLGRKIKVIKDVVCFGDPALEASCHLLLLGRIAGITAGNYRI